MTACRQYQGIAALLAMSLALLLVVAACGGDDEDSGTTATTPATTTTTTTTAPAAAPTAAPAPAPADTMTSDGAGDSMMAMATVDRLIFGTLTPNTEHSDHRAFCCFDAAQLRPMYENLLGLDAGGEFVPNLATEWTLEPNGQDWRIKLKEGVQFHDGTDFIAADMVRYFEELTKENPEVTRHIFSIIFWGRFVDHFEVVNDYEMVMRMKTPNAFVPLALSDRWTQFPAVSSADFAANGHPETPNSTPLAGTGPYQFVDRMQGQYILFENAPGEHHRAEPDFQELEFRWISEVSTRLSSLLAGEIHMADIPPDLQPQAVSRDFNVISNTNFGTRVWMQYHAGFDIPEAQGGGWPLYPEAALNKVEVRQALNKAVDRNEVLNAFAPHGEIMVLNHFHPTFAAWNPEWAQNFDANYGYDPAAARSLLRQAGYDSNNPLEIKTRIRSCVVMAGCQDVTEAIAGYWQDVGVKVSLETPDSATYSAVGRATRRGEPAYEDAIVDWVNIDNSSTHPVFALTNRLTGLQTSNPHTYVTPEINMNVRSILQEPDWSKHEPFLRNVGELSYSLFSNLPLWYLPAQVTVDPSIVESYVWNGTEHGTFTHFEEIVAVKQ